MSVIFLRAIKLQLEASSRFRQSVRNFCRKYGATGVPAACPTDGLIVDAILGTRFGAWIMPNNKDVGMVETFCQSLVPIQENPDLWAYAKNSANHARDNLAAPFRESHIYKAQMHTWLAWQDQPGERMGTAITRKILKPELGLAKSFSDWFRKLYGV